MAVSLMEIAWVAGLLEGEGCFSNVSKKKTAPLIQLVMSDADSVIKVAGLLGARHVIRCKLDTRGKQPKPLFRCALYGNHAIRWMMTIYPLMSERRRAKIEEIIGKWKATKRGKGNHKPNPRLITGNLIWSSIRGR